MKVIPYLVSLPLVLLCLVPVIKFYIPMPKDNLWFWYVLIAGFAGFYTLFLKTNKAVKIIAIGAFINCFFSSAIYFSFTAYISLIVCIYYYILCSKCEHWTPVFNTLKAILLLNVLLMIMQFIGYDSLLNFGLEKTTQFGIIGHHMQMGSFSIILSAFLISINPLFIIFPFITSYISISLWTFVSAGIGLAAGMRYNKKICILILLIIISLSGYIAHTKGKIQSNVFIKCGRVRIWQESIQIANIHPITGWGIGTYKHIFPALSKSQCTPYKTAHNFLVQILFETGYPGLIAAIIGLGFLFHLLIKFKLTLCLAGLSMIVVNGLVHFPDRMIQTVPIIIVFLAYCTYKLKERIYGKPA